MFLKIQIRQSCLIVFESYGNKYYTIPNVELCVPEFTRNVDKVVFREITGQFLFSENISRVIVYGYYLLLRTSFLYASIHVDTIHEKFRKIISFNK